MAEDNEEVKTPVGDDVPAEEDDDEVEEEEEADGDKEDIASE